MKLNFRTLVTQHRENISSENHFLARYSLMVFISSIQFVSNSEQIMNQLTTVPLTSIILATIMSCLRYKYSPYLSDVIFLSIPPHHSPKSRLNNHEKCKLDHIIPLFKYIQQLLIPEYCPIPYYDLKRPFHIFSLSSHILSSYATLISCLFLHHAHVLPLLGLCDCCSLCREASSPVLAPSHLPGFISSMLASKTSSILCQHVFPLLVLFHSLQLISFVALST